MCRKYCSLLLAGSFLCCTTVVGEPAIINWNRCSVLYVRREKISARRELMMEQVVQRGCEPSLLADFQKPRAAWLVFTVDPALSRILTR